MASTILLSRTIGLTQNFNRNAPLTFTGSNEPALSNADWVRQFILGPPFAWPWNRAENTVTCVVGTQDYPVSLPTFGWLEKAIIIDPTSGNQVVELDIEVSLGTETLPNQPQRCSAQSDDGAGKITFRLMPPPDREYQLRLIFQKAAPLFVAPTDTWAPIPDKLSYLFNQGFLAKAYEYLDDERFGIAMPMFLRQVIAANAGLDDTQVNLFLTDRINTQRTSDAALGLSQQGRQGRGMF